MAKISRIEVEKKIIEELESEGNIIIISKLELRKLFNIKKRSSNVKYKDCYLILQHGLKSLFKYCECGNLKELHKYYDNVDGCSKKW